MKYFLCRICQNNLEKKIFFLKIKPDLSLPAARDLVYQAPHCSTVHINK